VEDERLVIDGDLLGEFQNLPLDAQNSIATRLAGNLGRAFQPAAIIALLRNRT
jgi:hypothetical protein